jgi:hypothetical protein
MIIGRRKLKYSEKSASVPLFFTRNPPWTSLGLNLGLHGEELVTGYLSYGIAHMRPLVGDLKHRNQSSLC